MQIASYIFLLLIGFVLLIQGAKGFVNASVDMARRMKIPTLVIGLTIVAFGTSAPEIAISVTAAIGGSSDLAMANSVGANLFNLLFIVGFCVMIFPMSTRLNLIARDYWVSMVATIVLLIVVVVFEDLIPRWVSFVMIAGFMTYMAFLIRGTIKNKKSQPKEEETHDKPPMPMWKCVVISIIGVAAIAFGGHITVTNATNLALVFGISERVVGLTVVAIGTSLPELVTTFIACRKGEGEFALGFIIGSNIFNILIVLGLAGVITPLAIGPGALFDISVLALGTFLFYIFAKSNKRLVRMEGAAMTLFYVAYMTVVLLN
ncbi:MAG: calcium/sodium antiporter [Defluviitaleaceae bacterium]|nr:calcium/sodium antiporter [Defluviitaleaceae bacterium]